MALKFLNKKGWHTGSLRNIENVWKAEQKHEAEQKKLEELRLQIQQERERSEFRALQEQAGLVPRQERLEFLYDSGLAVGKGASSSSGGVGVAFKELEQPTKADNSNNNNNQQSSVPGALFEDKQYSANDAWRKLHSDPLLQIRQREQEALARLKNNPVKMALIRRSVEEKEGKKKDSDKNKRKKKGHKHASSKSHSDLEEDSAEEERGKRSKDLRASRSHDKRYGGSQVYSDDELGKEERGGDLRRKEKHRLESPPRKKPKQHSPTQHSEWGNDRRHGQGSGKRSRIEHYDRENRDEAGGRRLDRDEPDGRKRERDEPYGKRWERRQDHDGEPCGREREQNERNGGGQDRDVYDGRPRKHNEVGGRLRNRDELNGKTNSHEDSKYSKCLPDNRIGNESGKRQQSSELRPKRRNAAPKLSEEERAARLREMQMDAELHEEQRWKRLKKAEEDDAWEAKRNENVTSVGKNFLDAAQKSVYGAGKGGSATIEESVRRRTHYAQRGSEAEGHAFRR